MKKIIPILIFYLTASKGIEAITPRENLKQTVIAVENTNISKNADTLEKTIYKELNYKIKTKILGTGQVRWGDAKIIEKQSKDNREIKVKFTGAIGWLARCFCGGDEIISLTNKNQERKYIEFKKEFYRNEDELDPLIYCMDIRKYIKQPFKQKIISGKKRWWIWSTHKRKEKIKLNGQSIDADLYRLDLLERKATNPLKDWADVYFSENKGIATKGEISFLKGALQVEAYLIDNP